MTKKKVLITGDPQFLGPIKNQIDGWLDVRIVGLQEVGWLQYKALVDEYDDAGWDLRFASLRRTGPVADPTSQASAHPGCTFGPDAPYQQGQVLMVKGSIANYDVVDLPFGEKLSDGDKYFTLQCGEFTIPGVTKTIRACNTHLAIKANDDANLSGKKAQLERIEALTDPHVDSKIVALTGDFNIGPTSPHMDNIYRLTLAGYHRGDGEFREADQTGTYCADFPREDCRSMEPTKGGHRIDYVFFNRQVCDNATLSGGVIDSPHSDHRIKRGRCDVM